MVHFHVHESGIRVRFTVVIPSLKAGRMPVIDRLTLQEAVEQLQVSLVPAFAFPSSMYKNRFLHFAFLLQEVADSLQIPGTGFLFNMELTEILLIQKADCS